MEFLVRADAQIIGPTWFHTVQGGDRATIFNPLFELGFGAGAGGLGTGNFINSRRDSYLTLDMRAGLQGESWSLMAFAQNLTDENILEEVIGVVLLSQFLEMWLSTISLNIRWMDKEHIRSEYLVRISDKPNMIIGLREHKKASPL